MSTDSAVAELDDLRFRLNQGRLAINAERRRAGQMVSLGIGEVAAWRNYQRGLAEALRLFDQSTDPLHGREDEPVIVTAGRQALFDGGPLHGRSAPLPPVGVSAVFYPLEDVPPGVWVDAVVEPDTSLGRYVSHAGCTVEPVHMVWVEPGAAPAVAGEGSPS